MRVAERVQRQALEFDPVRVALTILMAPFYVAGFLLGTVWFLIAWVWSAVAVGLNDGRRRPPSSKAA